MIKLIFVQLKTQLHISNYFYNIFNHPCTYKYLLYLLLHTYIYIKHKQISSFALQITQTKKGKRKKINKQEWFNTEN